MFGEKSLEEFLTQRKVAQAKRGVALIISTEKLPKEWHCPSGAGVEHRKLTDCTIAVESSGCGPGWQKVYVPESLGTYAKAFARAEGY